MIHHHLVQVRAKNWVQTVNPMTLVNHRAGTEVQTTTKGLTEKEVLGLITGHSNDLVSLFSDGDLEDCLLQNQDVLDRGPERRARSESHGL